MAESEDTATYENRLYDVAEQLQLPDSTAQITRVRLDRLGGDSDIDDAQLAGIAPAVLALSCREDGLPLSDGTIVDAWNDGDGQSVAVDRLPEQIGAVADRLDIEQPPARPDTLVGQYVDALDAPEALAPVGRRLLADAFDQAPRVVAEASSPSETAGAAIVLAAEANELDGYSPSDVADVAAAGGVTIKNRYKAFREALGADRLAGSERYSMEAVSAGTEAAATEPDSEDATGDPETPAGEEAGASGVSAEACLDVVTETFPDELPTTTTVAQSLDAPADAVGDRLQELADDDQLQAKRAGETVAWLPADQGDLGEELTADAVQKEVDALAAALDLDASIRLFARGLISEAAEEVPLTDAGEFAGAALIASSRINDGELAPADVAAERDFEPRALYDWLDQLGGIADVEIPRRAPDDVVESLVDDLDLSETVREESRRTISQYQRSDDDAFAPPELAAGAVFFAATTLREPIDVDALAESIGFSPTNVSDAMNSVFVSLCRRLLLGEIDYEDCSWTAELLESDHIAEIGDPHTGRVVAAATTYIAGREDDHVDEGTLDVLLAED